jgi:hypothetical protein
MNVNGGFRIAPAQLMRQLAASTHILAGSLSEDSQIREKDTPQRYARTMRENRVFTTLGYLINRGR